MILSQVIYIAFCVAFAYINARWIKRDLKINHAWNGLAHIAVITTIALLSQHYLLFAILPFIGKSFFDIALNLFRHIPIGYIPQEPKSKLDQFEKWVFVDDGICAKSFYIAIAVCLNIFACL